MATCFNEPDIVNQLAVECGVKFVGPEVRQMVGRDNPTLKELPDGRFIIDDGSMEVERFLSKLEQVLSKIA